MAQPEYGAQTICRSVMKSRSQSSARAVEHQQLLDWRLASQVKWFVDEVFDLRTSFEFEGFFLTPYPGAPRYSASRSRKPIHRASGAGIETLHIRHITQIENESEILW